MTRAERFRAAIAAIEARGEQPTARAVLRECGYARRMQDDGYGTLTDNGMGGEELRIFAAAMEERGYHRVAVGYTNRWRR